MDLFVVNRYYGDERSSKFLIGNSNPDQEREEDRSNIPEVSDTHKVKKNKKKEVKLNLSLDPEISSSRVHSDNVTSSPKKKKTKRKQLEESVENYEIQENTLIEENGTSIIDTIVKVEANQTEGHNSEKKKTKRKNIEDTSEHTETLSTKKLGSDSFRVTEISGHSNQNERKLSLVKYDPSEDSEKVVSIENQSNDVNIKSCKKKKRKSENSSNNCVNHDKLTVENENALTKKKKIKQIDFTVNIKSEEIQSNLEISQDPYIKSENSSNNCVNHDELTVENENASTKKKKIKQMDFTVNIKSEEIQSNIEISQDTYNLDHQNDTNKTSSSSKKKKTVTLSPRTEKKLPTVTGDKLKTLQIPSKIDDKCSQSLTLNQDIKSPQNKIIEIGPNKSNENVSKENKPDETSKKGKKRFRQRARYKDKPKSEKSKEEEKEEESTVDKESSEDEEQDENSKDLGGFQVIGNLEFQRKKKVKRVLPNWLAKPTVISMNLKNLKTKVEDVKELDPYYKKMLRKNRVSHFFPVQSELIPFLIKQHSRRTIFWPRDVCVSAPTGSGKTLAFVLPILQLLQFRVVPRIRALIVLPTQDLASQVYSVFKSYVKATKLQVVLTVGSSPIQEEQKKLVHWDPMKKKLVSLVDIVVTTPGRLVDHLTNSPGFDLSALKFLVVDEADRMIDNNDCNWLIHINKHINYQGLSSAPPLMLHTFLTYPPRPQRLLFSATLSHDPEKLHALGLFQPKLFTSVVDASGSTGDTSIPPVLAEAVELPDSSSGFIGKFTTPAELSEKLTTTSASLKPLVVHQLIKRHAWKGVLCFVNTAQGAHRLAKLLHLIDTVSSRTDSSATKLNIAEVYSDLKFEQRTKIIQDFRRRKIDVVVASDNLARGIDVENIDVVINYEAPDNIKKYIHRIGRTARGGREGTSVTLVTTHERNAFLKMLSSAGKQNIEELACEEEGLEPMEQVYAKALEMLKKDVEREGEITLKIAKAQKKGKIIKKKKMLLDGSLNKTTKNIAQNKTSNDNKESRKEKSRKLIKGDKEKKTAENKITDVGLKAENNTSQKTVKRNQIKKVVTSLNWKRDGQKGKFNNRKTKKNKTSGVGPFKAEGKNNNMGMKRNLKIKKKKQMKKKQVQEQRKGTQTKTPK